jgi:hypothetical protein
MSLYATSRAGLLRGQLRPRAGPHPAARQLHVSDLAAAAIGDAGLRDLAGIDGVTAEQGAPLIGQSFLQRRRLAGLRGVVAIGLLHFL